MFKTLESNNLKLLLDPLGVLNDGEIHIKRSRPMMGPNGIETDLVIGDVLVSRFSH